MVGVVLTLVVPVVYFTVGTARTGRTLGKVAMGCRVVRLDGRLLDVRGALLRSTLFALGVQTCVLALVDGRGRCGTRSARPGTTASSVPSSSMDEVRGAGVTAAPPYRHRSPVRARPARLVTRPFVAVTFATFAFFCAVGINLPLLPQYVSDGLGASGLGVGIVIGAYSVAAVAVRPVLSWMADRYGPRTMMRLGPAVAVVGYALSATNDVLAVLVVLRMVVGVAEAFQFVGAATIVNGLAPPERRAEAASYYSVAVFGGLGVGPLVGEALTSGGRYHEAFLLAAGCCLIALAATSAVPRTLGRPGREDQPDEPAAPLLHRGALATGTVLALGIFGFTAWAAFVTLQAEAVGLDNATLVFVVYSVLVLVVRVAGARLPERIGLGRCAAAALALDVLGLATLAVWASPAGVYAGTVVLGLGTSLLYPALQTITVNAVPERERSSAVSTFTMFFEIGGAAGALTLGVVADLVRLPRGLRRGRRRGGGRSARPVAAGRRAPTRGGTGLSRRPQWADGPRHRHQPHGRPPRAARVRAVPPPRRVDDDEGRRHAADVAGDRGRRCRRAPGGGDLPPTGQGQEPAAAPAGVGVRAVRRVERRVGAGRRDRRGARPA